MPSRSTMSPSPMSARVGVRHRIQVGFLAALLLLLVAQTTSAEGPAFQVTVRRWQQVKGGVALHNRLFFIANDGIHGRELWTTLGTAESTRLLRDIHPTDSAFAEHGPAVGPAGLKVANGMVFFMADDGVHGPELWRSDGTESGTVLVKDINPGAEGSSLAELTNVNGVIYFRANDGVHGSELWRSDGTEAGTYMVKDMIPLPVNVNLPGWLTDVNGTLFFSAFSEGTGVELWKSDGTAEGTQVVKDIFPGGGFSSGSDPRQLVNANGTLFFEANDGTTGYELWKSDGTPEGTVQVIDLNPGPEDGLIGLGAAGRRVFFTAPVRMSDRLWTSDGTAAGTYRIYEEVGVTNLQAAGSRLFFTVQNELWVSDGSLAGTRRVMSFPELGVRLWAPTSVGAGVYLFVQNPSRVSSDLWYSDGTTDGTKMVQSREPKMSNVALIATTEHLYFMANQNNLGSELWALPLPPMPSVYLPLAWR